MPQPKGVRHGGRQKGTPNKATADIKALARNYTDAAMSELARLSTGAASEQARVAAIKEIFDRAFGKATQLVAGDEDGAPILHVIERRIVKAGDRHG